MQTRNRKREQVKRLKRQVYDAVNKATEKDIHVLQNVVTTLQNAVKIG